MKKLLIFSLLLSNLVAFSTTNIQLLRGTFDGNSYVYDTKNGGKTTVTLEHYSSFEYGDIYGFIDHSVADDNFKYHDDKTDTYGEFAPRLNLSKLTSHDLRFSFVKQVYLAYQYNASNTYNANLIGLGSDLSVYGFDVFGINFYKKYQNIGKDTYQLSPYYKTKTLGNIFHIAGFIDWTEYDFLSQNQFLFDMKRLLKVDNLFIGAEWHYYKQKPLNLNFNSKVESNTLQAMIKYYW
ncbi:outer membrane protein OmpK [Sulfurimonas sp.]|uniref:outer membrane protein OmpK n=1 Tax=Sulfurimonas sp. TaxID=2022749 RepID=UPI0035676003